MSSMAIAFLVYQGRYASTSLPKVEGLAPAYLLVS